MDDQHLNFAHKVPPNGGFSPKCCIFWTKISRKFSDSLKFRGWGQLTLLPRHHYIYIFYSPHYSGRENKRTRNTTKQKNKQYKSTQTDQTLDIMQFIAVHNIIFPNEVLFTLFKLLTW